MNVEEQVATLEALLARVKKNAALPRALHGADADVIDVRAPIAARSAAEPAAEPVGVKPTPAEVIHRPSEVTPAPAEAVMTPAEPAAKAARGLVTTLPGMPGLAKPGSEPVTTKVAAAKPLEKAEPLKLTVTPVTKPMAPAVTARPPAPKPAETGSPRPPAVAPIARSTAPRPPAPSRPPVEPVVDKVVEKLEPLPTPEPAKVEPTPEPLKVEPLKAEKPVSTLKAPDENELLFNFDTEDAKPKRPEPPIAAKPIEKPIEKPAPKPVRRTEEEELTDEETKLMVGPIPDAARPPPGEEVTVDEETRILAAAEATRPSAPTPLATLATLEAPEEEELEEVTRLRDTSKDGIERVSAPKLELTPAPKVDLAPKVEIAPKVDSRAAPPKVEAEKVVVSAAMRAPVKINEPNPHEEETKPAIPIAPPAPIVVPSRPAEVHEATSPSRRFEPEGTTPKPPARTPMWAIGLAAALLIGAGAMVGLRNGWFGGTESGAGPQPPLSAIPVGKDTGTTSAAVTVPVPTSAAPVITAPPIDTASASATGSAAPSATVAPTTSAAAPPASAEPSAKPAVPEGDGSDLPPNKGFLVINSAKPSGVFLTGTFAGHTGEKLLVDCGFKFLRLGVAPADGNPNPAEVVWVSEGKSAAVACKKTTTITLEATK